MTLQSHVMPLSECHVHGCRVLVCLSVVTCWLAGLSAVCFPGEVLLAHMDAKEPAMTRGMLVTTKRAVLDAVSLLAEGSAATAFEMMCTSNLQILRAHKTKSYNLHM